MLRLCTLSRGELPSIEENNVFNTSTKLEPPRRVQLFLNARACSARQAWLCIWAGRLIQSQNPSSCDVCACARLSRRAEHLPGCVCPNDCMQCTCCSKARNSPSEFFNTVLLDHQQQQLSILLSHQRYQSTPLKLLQYYHYYYIATTAITFTPHLPRHRFQTIIVATKSEVSSLLDHCGELFDVVPISCGCH